MTINVFSSFVCKEYVIVHALLTKHVLEKSSLLKKNSGRGVRDYHGEGDEIPLTILPLKKRVKIF